MPSCLAHRSSRAVLALTAATLTCTLAAQTPPSSPSPGSPRPATPPATAPAPAPPAQAAPQKEPVVTLLEPGAEPRQAQRLKITKGAVCDMGMLMSMQMTMSMNGMAMPPQSLPGMRTRAAFTVTDVRPNGDMAYDFEYRDFNAEEAPGVAPEMLDQVRDMLASLKGAHGTGVFTNRSIGKEFALTMPPGVDPMVRQQGEQMSQAMRQMTMPLPEEPVGVGARWRVETELLAGGIRMKMVREATLQKIEGDILTLALDITQSAEPQDVSNPQLPPGATLHVDSMKSTGNGTSVLDLTRLLPAQAEFKVTTDADMTINMGAAGGGGEQKMSQHMEISTTMGKPAAAAAPAATAPATPAPGGATRP